MSIWFTQNIIITTKYRPSPIQKNKKKRYQPIGDVLGNEQNNRCKLKSLTKMYGTKKEKGANQEKEFYKQKLEN